MAKGNSWGICYKDGALACSDSGRAHVYLTRREAQMHLPEATREHSSLLHIESVEVRDTEENDGGLC